MSGSGEPERLDVVAALVEFDARRSDLADMWVHQNGMPYRDDEAALITPATLGEWILAEALRGGPDQAPDADSAAIVDLLRLASGTDAAALLCLGLRETFLDHQPEDRAAAFADLFRRLALPGLAGEPQEQAEALLALGRG